MCPYKPSPESDVLLLHWWLHLKDIHELESTFGKEADSLSAFYALFRGADRLLMYDVDEDGIAIAFLVSPVMSGAFVTVWVSEKHRQSRAALAGLELCYEGALEQYPVLLGITRQERLLAVHERWGYTVLGKVPGVFDGYDGWIVMLTEQSYYAAKSKRRAVTEVH